MKPRIKFPRSEKVYLSGNIYPELRVAMRKVEQVPSTTFVGEEKVITFSSPPLFILVLFFLLSHFSHLLLFLCLQFIDTTRGFAFQYIELEIFARDDTVRTQNSLYCESS